MSKKPPRKYEIIMLAERCKECGLCIHVCPKNVLDYGKKQNRRGYRVTVPIRPDDCVGCRLCEFTCPDFVIIIRPASDGLAKGIMVWGDGSKDVIIQEKPQEAQVVSR
ncbi:MAG: 4Fe-4S dicluster domain-containing protein [Pyrodictiaceae archaeon]